MLLTFSFNENLSSLVLGSAAEQGLLHLARKRDLSHFFQFHLILMRKFKSCVSVSFLQLILMALGPSSSGQRSLLGLLPASYVIYFVDLWTVQIVAYGQSVLELIKYIRSDLSFWTLQSFYDHA